jgi:hypothetical protein
MSERFKEAVLKTVVQQCTVGSNPTLSAIFWLNWRSAREAEGSSLLNCRARKCTAGSNPAFSASSNRRPQLCPIKSGIFIPG